MKDIYLCKKLDENLYFCSNGGSGKFVPINNGDRYAKDQVDRYKTGMNHSVCKYVKIKLDGSITDVE